MYYVNCGRWADKIIGPFATYTAADEYVEGMDHWSGAQRPTVVEIAPPKPKTKTYTIGVTHLDKIQRDLAAKWHTGTPKHDTTQLEDIEIKVQAETENQAFHAVRALLGWRGGLTVVRER